MSSSSARRSYDTDSIVLRRIYAYDLSNNPFPSGSVLTSLTKGVATFSSVNCALSSIGVPNLPDQLSTLTSLLISAITAFSPSVPSSPQVFLPSTVAGLGTAGYISSSQLVSTVDGIISQSQVTPANLQSTTIGIENELVSTSLGLTGSLLSTSQGQDIEFFSLIVNLGSLGYISTSQLTSTVEGLATAGYISTSQLTSTVEGLGSLGYISSSQFISAIQATGGTVRSSFSTLLAGNYSNVGFLYSNIPAGSNWRTIQFTFGSTFVQKITDQSKLDVELTPNMQFAFYDGTSRNYSFSTFLVAGGDNSVQTHRILASTSLSYYIENAFAINLPFIFRNSFRFQIQDPLAFSSIRAYGTYSTMTLWHILGNPAPGVNQYFASPDQPTCVNAVLDNTFTP